MIPGDGIGGEVVCEGMRVLDALAEDSGGAFAMGIQTAAAIEDALWEDIEVAGEDSEIGIG